MLHPAPILAIAICALGAGAQTLEVSPNRVMADESAAIRIRGLDPNERVTIGAELTDGAGHGWAAHAEFSDGHAAARAPTYCWQAKACPTRVGHALACPFPEPIT